MARRASPFGPTPKNSINGVHRFVRFLDDHRTIPIFALAEKAGVAQNSINRWRLKGHPPRLADIEAVLSVLGYELSIVAKDAAALKEIGDE